MTISARRDVPRSGQASAAVHASMTAPEDDGVRPYPRGRGGRPWSAIAVLATAAAGVVHVGAAGTHQSSGALHVGFFVLVGFAQLGLASAIAVGLARVAAGLGRAERSLRALLVVAVAGTVGLLALYLVVHSTDLLTGLIGSHEHGAGGGHGGSVGAPEGLPTQPPETLGTVGVVVELIALTAYTALLPRRWRTRVTDVLLVLGALAWLLWFTGGIL